jgi:outer membrane receptor for ferrienterochelin and colicin
MKQILPRLFTFAFLVFVVYHSAAQKVTIKGSIRDAEKKEGMFGATVMVEGSKIGAQSDFEGKYKLEIPPHTPAILIFRSVGFKAKNIQMKAIPAGETRFLDVELEEEAKENKEVTITVTRRRDTDVSLITDIKKSEMVVNGVSSEQIAKTQDRDAAQVMARVPGITVVDNRFVMIRGVNERYNTVMINDAISPGTEVDTRAFSFDLISSNMIERMLIFKSGAASLPGEFAGGVVKIYTKNTFGEDFCNLSLGSGFRPGTSLQTGFRPEGSSSDFLGFDNGKRGLPSSFPSTEKFVEMRPSEQVEHAKKLNGNFSNQSFKTLPDLRLNLNFGKKWNLGDKQLSTVGSLAYTSTFQNLEIRRFRYSTYVPELQRSQDTIFQYRDRSFSQNIRISAISNWMYRTKNARYEFKNLYNQMGDNEAVIRNGRNMDRSGDEFQNYSYNYLSRSLLSSQFLGSHDLNENTKIDWVAAYNFTNRNQPDFRRIKTFRQRESADPYQLLPAASAGGIEETGRFFSNLREHGVSGSGTLSKTLKVSWDSAAAILRTGLYTERKSRMFDARFFAYILKNPSGNQSLLTKPLSEIFSGENLATSRFVLEEGTRPQDAYQAQNLLAAGFVESMIPFGKMKIIAGFRPEYNVQSLQSGTTQGNVNISNPVLSPLGFFNASYSFSQKWVLRGAYSKTVNRPEFRELAPFLYYDFNLDVNFAGNQNLKVADIHNFDLRAEFYPSKGEMISLGAFYKHFINPIETRISPVGLAPQFTYSNAKSADNYGIEVEFRKAIGQMGGNRFIDRLVFVSNASLIHSQVNMGVVTAQERIRSLQGQSPYVVNGGLFYTDKSGKTSITAMYNVFGKRIFMVGDNMFPTIYEMPRHVVDLAISRQLSKKVNFRFAANDLLNYQTQFFQDSNRDGNIGTKDEIISAFRRGSYFSFAFVYSIL